MRISIRILSMLIGLSTLAQAQQIERSNPDLFSKKPYSKIIAQFANEVFFVKSSNTFNAKSAQIRIRDSKIELVSMDTSMKPKWTSILDLELFPNAEIEHIVVFSQKIYVFFSSVDKEGSVLNLFQLTYNMFTGEAMGAALKVDEMPYERRRDRGLFYISQNKEGNRLFIFHRESSDGNSDFTRKEGVAPEAKEQLSFKVFGEGMVPLLDKRFPNLNYVGIQSVRDLAIDNKGNVFVLTAYRMSQGTPAGEYRLLKCTPNTDALKDFKIKLDKKAITDLKLVIDNLNSTAVVGGFYAENNTFASSGVLYTTLTIDNDSLSPIHFESFKAKFLNDYSGERTINRSSELINYEVDKIIVRSDGGMVVLAESNFVTESSSYNSYYQLYTVTYTYHYENVMILSVNPDGTLDWGNVMRKSQSSENDDAFFSSYALFASENELSLIYNRGIRRKTDIMRYVIDSRGVAKESILVSGAEELMLMPKGCKQVNAKLLIIPCTDKSKPGLLKLSF